MAASMLSVPGNGVPISKNCYACHIASDHILYVSVSYHGCSSSHCQLDGTHASQHLPHASLVVTKRSGNNSDRVFLASRTYSLCTKLALRGDCWWIMATGRSPMTSWKQRTEFPQSIAFHPLFFSDVMIKISVIEYPYVQQCEQVARTQIWIVSAFWIVHS